MREKSDPQTTILEVYPFSNTGAIQYEVVLVMLDFPANVDITRFIEIIYRASLGNTFEQFMKTFHRNITDIQQLPLHFHYK